jgi:uncharacterized protein YcfL
MKTFFQFALAILLFTSCDQDSSLTNNFDNQTVSTRTSSNMSISITHVNKSVTTISAAKVNVTYGSDNTFTVVTNPGTISQQTFTAVGTSITEPNNKLKVVKNPGLNQTVYMDKSITTISADNENMLLVNIQPGNISTSAISLIVEEQDGF